MGFGIKDAVAAGQVAQVADGVVVGSALVSLLAEHADDVDAASGALQAAVADLRQGSADWLVSCTERRWVGGIEIVPGRPNWRWKSETSAPVLR